MMLSTFSLRHDAIAPVSQIVPLSKFSMAHPNIAEKKGVVGERQKKEGLDMCMYTMGTTTCTDMSYLPELEGKSTYFDIGSNAGTNGTFGAVPNIQDATRWKVGKSTKPLPESLGEDHCVEEGDQPPEDNVTLGIDGKSDVYTSRFISGKPFVNDCHGPGQSGTYTCSRFLSSSVNSRIDLSKYCTAIVAFAIIFCFALASAVVTEKEIAESKFIERNKDTLLFTACAGKNFSQDSGNVDFRRNGEQICLHSVGECTHQITNNCITITLPSITDDDCRHNYSLYVKFDLVAEFNDQLCNDSTAKDEKKVDDPVGTIVGIVFGVVLALIVVAVLVCAICYKGWRPCISTTGNGENEVWIRQEPDANGHAVLGNGETTGTSETDV